MPSWKKANLLTAVTVNTKNSVQLIFCRLLRYFTKIIALTVFHLP